MECITKMIIIAAISYVFGVLVGHFTLKDIVQRKIMKKLQETPAP